MNRALGGAAVVCAAVIAGACQPASATKSPDAGSVAIDERPPINRDPGEVLDLTIPLFDGDAIELASLRGRVVVLELSATWVETWDEAHHAYRGFVAKFGEEVAVITVAMDMSRDELTRQWDADPPPFVLGWDPQGALAARLQVAKLPTVVVIDREGNITDIRGGPDATDTGALEARVREVVEAAQSSGGT